MHTVIKTGQHFLVIFADPDPDVLNTKLVWFRDNFDAFKFCSWLNGGEFPSLSAQGLEDIAYSPTMGQQRRVSDESNVD